VELDHEGPYKTSYSHLSSVAVKKGQKVRQGDLIGRVGSTGLATGPHLHYQMWQNGKYVDPMSIALPNMSAVTDAERAQFVTEVKRWLPMLPDDPAE
jgi:murein DD-endopeptidase MepM/ murein hydrolase activator NlpD